MKKALRLVVAATLSLIILLPIKSNSSKKKSVELVQPLIFDFKSQSSLDFISLLIRMNMFGGACYTFKETIKGWVKREDIPVLLLLLDSNEPCANVCSQFSSHLDQTPSTVGQEVLFIINGYITGRYPPGLNSTKNHLFDKQQVKIG